MGPVDGSGNDGIQPLLSGMVALGANVQEGPGGPEASPLPRPRKGKQL